MKKYSLSSDIREKVYGFIFTLSIILSTAATLLFNILVQDHAVDNIGVLYLNIFILPTVGGINLGLKWLFDNYLWDKKIFAKIIQVQNLSGEWSIEGESSTGDTYGGTLHIKQTFSEILIKGVFLKSTSFNEETFLSLRNNEIVLSYYYLNELKNKEDGMTTHHGFIKITFDLLNMKAEGKYFTDDFRKTQGHWSLEKNIRNN